MKQDYNEPIKSYEVDVGRLFWPFVISAVLWGIILGVWWWL